VTHSDSTSAIARAEHSGASPGQPVARSIQRTLTRVLLSGRSAEIRRVKGHAGIPGNEKPTRWQERRPGRPPGLPPPPWHFSSFGSPRNLGRPTKPSTRNPSTTGRKRSPHHPIRNRAWIELGMRWLEQRRRSAPATGGQQSSSRGSGSAETINVGSAGDRQPGCPVPMCSSTARTPNSGQSGRRCEKAGTREASGSFYPTAVGITIPQISRALERWRSHGIWDGRGRSSGRKDRRVDSVRGGGEGRAVGAQLPPFCFSFSISL
jgi:hypothetical protein